MERPRNFGRLSRLLVRRLAPCYIYGNVYRGRRSEGSNFAINLVSFDAADVLFKQYLLFSSSFMACCVIDAAILGIGNNLIWLGNEAVMRTWDPRGKEEGASVPPSMDTKENLRCEDSANYETNITMRKQMILKSFLRPVDLCGKETSHCQGKGKRLHCRLAILPLTAF